MLASEWRELETLCNLISSLRHRYTAAQRSKNTGLVGGLQLQIAHVKQQRERLVQHISARLGSAVGERHQGPRIVSNLPAEPDWAVMDPARLAARVPDRA
ncbi:MAG TPA: hypothetical protein VND95_02935 [Stellaceae bacterium]|nr:hypothetical protein [Stellaceae bacterium]